MYLITNEKNCMKGFKIAELIGEIVCTHWWKNLILFRCWFFSHCTNNTDSSQIKGPEMYSVDNDKLIY